MALKSRKADEVTSPVFYNHTGIYAFKVVAYNPTLAELKKLGFNFTNETEYVATNDYGTSYKSVFWLKNCEKVSIEKGGKIVEVNPGDIVQPLTFFIQQGTAKSQTGKTLFINKFGKDVWAEDIESLPEWFNSEGVREAYKGESNLYNFLMNYANLKWDDENCMEDPEQLFKDDSFFKEFIQGLMENNHIVRCMVELKSGGETESGEIKVREQIYPQFFQKFNQTTTGKFREFITASKVKEENREAQVESRKPKGELWSYEPKLYDLQEAREAIQKVINSESDADSEDYSSTSDADKLF